MHSWSSWQPPLALRQDEMHWLLRVWLFWRQYWKFLSHARRELASHKTTVWIETSIIHSEACSYQNTYAEWLHHTQNILCCISEGYVVTTITWLTYACISYASLLPCLPVPYFLLCSSSSWHRGLAALKFNSLVTRSHAPFYRACAIGVSS